GYLFNGTTTGGDMLNDIAAADINFAINITNGFLNDVTYGSHSGIGNQPDWWSTWDGADLASLTSNTTGIAATISPGEWFGISYGFTPSAVKPGLPIPAFDPNTFTTT